MGEHGWVFPWFAVVAGAVALVVGCLIGGLRVSRETKWPISLIVIWLIASIAFFIASLHLGALSGVDYISARGFLLGAVSGLVLSWLARTAPRSFAPVLIGCATLSIAAGRLWLTHGEISGLTALALGASVAVLCLAVAPALASPTENADLLSACRAAISALLFLVGLDICVQLGFTKADALDKMYWADLPLLLAAALSLGALVAACLPERTRRRELIPALILVAAGALVAIPLSAKVAASWDFAGLLALGAMVCGFAMALPSGERALSENRSPASPALLGALLLVAAGATVAFAVWSGYGLALFLLGGWFSCGWSLMARDENAPVGATRPSDIAALAMFGFGTVLLVYRIATLQSGSGIRSSGPGDIWDLFAICLGALLTLMIAQWTVQQANEARGANALVALQWLIAAIVPVLVLEYIWRPRALAAFLVGAGLAQLVAVLGASIRQMAAANATGLVLAITLLDFLPWIGGSESPTRPIRLVLIVVLALVIVLRILLPARLSGARPAAQEG